MLRFFCSPPPWRRLALLLPLLAALGSCKKDPIEQLPAATQNGANTFGCLVNGKPWVPGGARTSSGRPVKFDVEYYTLSDDTRALRGRFALTVYRENDEHDDNIVIAIDSLANTGTHLLHTRTPPYPAQTPYPDHGAYFSTRPTQATYVTSTTNTGNITITRLDTAAHIIAGTFSFTAGPYSTGTTGTVQITEGRFDINTRNH